MSELPSNKMNYVSWEEGGGVKSNFFFKLEIFVLYTALLFYTNVANTDPTDPKKIFINLHLEMLCLCVWLYVYI